jgi:glycosyltransferase involved in cell wall biosynthesis
MKLHIVLRTCDKVSLANNRIVPKDECVLRCLQSIINSLWTFVKLEYSLHIIDDRSTQATIDKMKLIAPNAKFTLLGERDETGLNNKQKSRYSVKVAYDYIYSLPKEDLVYIVEDDYLHYPDAITKMIEAYEYFTSYVDGKSIGIFPQDFTELYPHPQNKFNDTYVKPCIVIPGPDRYYRTTWFTHESFLIPVSVIYKYKRHFDALLTIGSNEAYWEGNTISNVWESNDVMMLMPIMKTHCIHVSKKEDIPFYNNDFEMLWAMNKY